jgi:hypothetical protein
VGLSSLTLRTNCSCCAVIAVLLSVALIQSSLLMLIYAQLFGSTLNRTLPLDLRADETIADLQRRLLQMHEGIVIKRCIFAGKQLDDVNKTIGQLQEEGDESSHGV